MDSLELRNDIIDFEHLLSVDELFADYFNNFCEISFFPQKIVYCTKSQHLLKLLSGKRKDKWHQADNLAIIDCASFVSTFKIKWLKYFICSYQYLEYRVAKLISQVKLDLISRKITCKTFTNVLISTGTTSEENEANLIKTICSCWNEADNWNMVSADEWSERTFECQNPKSEVCEDEVNILEQDIEKNGEDVILKTNFLNSKDVLEFYNFLPKVAAQPLWILWVEVQKILLMQNCCDWFSNERALQKLRELYHQKWMCCLRLKRLIEKFCKQDSWNLEQIASVADGAIHCLITYWVPRYLLNKRQHVNKHLQSLPTIHSKSVLNILCKYSHNQSIHKDAFNRGTHSKNMGIENKLRKLRTAGSREPVKFSEVVGGGGNGGGGNGGGDNEFNRKSKSSRSRNNSSGNDIVDEKMDEDEDDGADMKYLSRQKLRRLVSADEFVGSKFYSFLKDSQNQDWLNKYCFLKECQELKMLSQLSPLSNKASEIYARFLSSGCDEKLNSVTEKSINEIHSNLKFPRAEMFEKIEQKVEEELLAVVNSFHDHVLESLKELKCLELEQQLKCKDGEICRDLEECTLNVEGSHSTNPLSASMSRHLSKTSKLRSAKSISSLKSIRSFYGNRIELENFKNFLTEQKAGVDFYFWQDIEIYKQLAEGSDEQKFKAEEIFRLYVNEKYYLGTNTPASKQQLEENTMKCYEYNPVLANVKSINSFLEEAQVCVHRRLENIWLPLYLSQREARSRKSVINRKHNDGHASDFSKSLKKEKINELFFRKLLLDNAVADNFIQFVALKDEKHEMDVQFLAEVYKYEDLWCNNVGMSSIQHKADAIVNSFISSNFPPSIQISIEQELADKIQSKNKRPTATLFKEAQKLVLASISKYFAEFEKLRDQMSNQELFLHLTDERKKKQASMLRSRLKKLSSKESVEKLMSREQMNEVSEANTDLISWTYSEYMINLFNARLKQAQEQQVRTAGCQRTAKTFQRRT